MQEGRGGMCIELELNLNFVSFVRLRGKEASVGAKLLYPTI